MNYEEEVEHLRKRISEITEGFKRIIDDQRLAYDVLLEKYDKEVRKNKEVYSD